MGPLVCLVPLSSFTGDPRAQYQLSEEVLGEGVPLGRALRPRVQQDGWVPATGTIPELRVGEECPRPPVLKGQDPKMGRKRGPWQKPRANLEPAASQDTGQGNKWHSEQSSWQPQRDPGGSVLAAVRSPTWEPGTLQTGEPYLRRPSKKGSTAGAQRPRGPACAVGEDVCTAPFRKGPCGVPWA